MQSGLVVVDKPAAWTSHDVVARIRKIYGQKRVGHAGTLDPDATGVLLVGLGRVTRLLRFLQESTKEYRGDVVFGIATTTLDAAGDVVEAHPMPVTRAQVESAARGFVGDVLQVPPMVSAIKVGGRRLHELARAGEDVERAPRAVHIANLVIEEFVAGEHPRATIRVECGSGTYIRSLAADLGAALGGVAHLGSLRRLRVGSFTESDAWTLDAIERDPLVALRTPADAMRGLSSIVVDDTTAEAVKHGARVPASVAGTSRFSDDAAPVAVLDRDGALLAVCERRGDVIAPLVVVAAPT